jgi:hypothetical protein
MTMLPLTVHALVTPSHMPMLERWFLPSLPVECRPVIHSRDAEPVVYAQGSWHRVVGQKFDIVLETISTLDDGELFVMSDVDVCFYGSFVDDARGRMDGLEVLFQNNRPTLPLAPDNVCTGFMVIRATSRSRDFFERARNVLVTRNSAIVGDQNACIEILRTAPDAIRWGFLPVTYWSPGDPRGRWEPGMSLAPPDGMLLHHANHTVGVDNKLAQLEAVAAIMELRRRTLAGPSGA